VKLSTADFEDPNAVAFVGVAVGVRAEYHDALPRGLPYLTMVGVAFLVRVEEFCVTVLGYVMYAVNRITDDLCSIFFVRNKAEDRPRLVYLWKARKEVRPGGNGECFIGQRVGRRGRWGIRIGACAADRLAGAGQSP
jgi:hypothetical protein